MKLARYIGQGQIAILDEPEPALPPGGLMIRTLASGLCSGELMDWYMDRKVPHVIGHEVCGVVVASEDSRFPEGSVVSPHHHAPCFRCEACDKGAYVHCPTWKATKLIPGGLSEAVAVPAANLADTALVNDLNPPEAALMEPLACVAKSVRQAGTIEGRRVAIIGLGAMGIMHMLAVPGAVGYETNPRRLVWAQGIGLDARPPDNSAQADVVFVCPGTEKALATTLSMAAPQSTIVLFAPLPPSSPVQLDLSELYFREVTLTPSYSCGPNDTALALQWLREGKIKANQVVSDFVTLEELPQAYQDMKQGTILKPMVVFN